MTDNCKDTDMRCGHLITAEKKRLWAVLMDLALELQRVCEKYRLQYFLHAGSLLGAVRHKGFIPWDDDMDFILPRADCQRLLQVGKHEFRHPYHLQTPDNTTDLFNNGRIMLRRSDTTGVQWIRDLYSKSNQGIGIDICILDVLCRDAALKNKQLKSIDFCVGLLYTKTYGKLPDVLASSKQGIAYLTINRAISKMLPRKYIVWRMNRLSLNYKSDSQLCIAVNERTARYREVVLNKEWYQESEYMSFENASFPCPKGYDDILKAYYGSDYLEYPAMEDRKGHHYPIVNTDQSYDVYLRHFHDIFRGVRNKTIVVYGAGNMVNHYLDNVSKKFWPRFIVDSDQKKWDSEIRGIMVQPPVKLCALPKENLHLIICSIHYRDIAKYLEEMGIKDYYIYVQNKHWL